MHVVVFVIIYCYIPDAILLTAGTAGVDPESTLNELSNAVTSNRGKPDTVGNINADGDDASEGTEEEGPRGDAKHTVEGSDWRRYMHKKR